MKTLWEGTGFDHPLKCESVKLLKPPSMSNVWHKKQKPYINV